MSAPPDDGGFPECGRALRAPAAGALVLTARFPAAAEAGTGVLSGTVEVLAEEAVRGTVGPQADALLVRDGRVVALPLAQDAVGTTWDLAAGQRVRLDAAVTLVDCAGGGPLPPGTYELHVRLALVDDEGRPRTHGGGPWPLELR